MRFQQCTGPAMAKGLKDTALSRYHRHSGVTDPNTEHFLYQTLVGAWPIDLKRISTYTSG
jgi:maltooligosyltrehalose synthase